MSFIDGFLFNLPVIMGMFGVFILALYLIESNKNYNFLIVLAFLHNFYMLECILFGNGEFIKPDLLTLVGFILGVFFYMILEKGKETKEKEVLNE